MLERRVRLYCPLYRRYFASTIALRPRFVLTFVRMHQQPSGLLRAHFELPACKAVQLACGQAALWVASWCG